MPKGDGKGPPEKSIGSQDGRGGGKGGYSNAKRIGKKKGGKQDNC